MQSFGPCYPPSLQLKAHVQVRSAAPSTDPRTRNVMCLKEDGWCLLVKRDGFPLNWASLTALSEMLFL